MAKEKPVPSPPPQPTPPPEPKPFEKEPAPGSIPERKETPFTEPVIPPRPERDD